MLPIPLFAAAIAVLWAADLRGAHESRDLLIALNLVFANFVSLFIAYLAARSFLASGNPGLLMLGCGVLIWGTTSVVAAASIQRGANFTVTVHNMGIWLAAACHLFGAVCVFRSQQAVRTRRLWLTAVYAWALTAVAWVTFSASAQWTPIFFIQGQGGTPFRQAVLGSAIGMFCLTALLMAAANRRSPSAFLYWYALGLALLATGLLGVMLQPVHGGVLSWTGRAAQYLGGLYMLMAAIASVRQTGIWGLLLAQALQEARRQNEFLANIIQHSSQALGIGYLDGRVGFVNPAFERLTGYSADELRALDWSKTLTPPEWRNLERQKLEELARDGQPVRYEKEYVRKDGTRVPIELLVHLARDADSKPEFYYSFVTDITERRRAEETLRTERDVTAAMLDTAGALVVVLDKEARITRFNRACELITGYSPEEVLGRVWEFLIPPQELPGVRQTWQALQAGDFPNTHENHWVARDGSRRLIAWSNTAIVDPQGRIEYTIATGVDITERKRIEEELAAAKTCAEQAKEAAEAANAAKDQFLSVLSHELRTPLTPVLIATSALEGDPTVPDWIREDMALIRRSVQLETKLIDDLLDVNRIARGKLMLKTEDLDAHAKILSAIEMCRADAKDKRLTLSVDLSAEHSQVRADAARLQQIVWNLVKNAVKFTPTGGRVQVGSLNPHPGLLRIEVTDEGIGIDPEALPRVFNAFEQADTQVTRQFGGLGLGLTITKALVEMHGGRITAASAGQGTGATFTVDLHTITTRAQPPPEAPARASPRSRALRILFVEDHTVTARILERMLSKAGHEVLVAGSVREALQLGATHGFDLLISDLGLPDGSGLEVIRALRAGQPEVKGIALSGFGMEADIERSRQAGFLEHLTKPVEFRTLEAAIARVTGT